MKEPEKEISQADYERRQIKAVVSPPKSLINRFVQSATKAGYTDAQIKFGVSKLITDHQKALVRKARAKQVAAEVIENTINETEKRLKQATDGIDE